jgi:hypothetical protein
MTIHEKRTAERASAISILIEEDFNGEETKRMNGQLFVVQNILDQYDRGAITVIGAGRMIKMIAEKL